LPKSSISLTRVPCLLVPPVRNTSNPHSTKRYHASKGGDYRPALIMHHQGQCENCRSTSDVNVSCAALKSLLSTCPSAPVSTTLIKTVIGTIAPIGCLLLVISYVCLAHPLPVLGFGEGWLLDTMVDTPPHFMQGSNLNSTARLGATLISP
jgi:hypothetical protein